MWSVLLACVSCLDQDSLKLRYLIIAGGRDIGREEITLAEDSPGSLKLSSRILEKDTVRFESDLLMDAANLLPRAYEVRSGKSRWEFKIQGDKIQVRADGEAREARRDPEAILVDPMSVSSFVLVLLKGQGREFKGTFSGTLETARLSMLPRGRANLLGKGRIVPVRKVFVKMEPLGVMAFLDDRGIPVLLLNPLGNKRYVMEGFESLELSRRSAVSLPPRVIENEVTFRSGDATLAGVTWGIKDPGRRAGIVILPAAGPVDRDGNTADLTLDLYRALAAELSREGYVVLRYDKRGTGRSEGNLSMSTFTQLVDDARQAVSFLRSLPEVDPDRVMLVGHDEGGVIASILAGEDKRVKGLLLLGCPADPLDTLLLGQVEASAREQKLPPEEIAQALKERRDYFAKIRAADDSWLDLGSQGKVFVGWLRERFRNDPLTSLRKVTCPVFVAHGESDRQVPPAHADRLGSAVKGSEVVRFRGLDHALMESENGELSRYADERAVDPGFLHYVVDVLRRTQKP